jgi:hypothetical protein
MVSWGGARQARVLTLARLLGEPTWPPSKSTRAFDECFGHLELIFIPQYLR